MSVSIYRKIDLSTWGDERFMRLSPVKPSGQSLWIALLTGPFTTRIPGVIPQRPEALAAMLGWTEAFVEGWGEAFREAFGEVCREGMAKADEKAGLIWLPNAPKYSKPESPNVIRSWKTTWELVPACALKAEIWDAFEACATVWGTPYREAFGEAFGEACRHPSRHPSHHPSPHPCPNQGTGNREQEKKEHCPSPELPEQEEPEEAAGTPDSDPDPAVEILAYLNERKDCAPQFRPTPGNLRGIRARLADGATPEDCRAVIEAKVAEWRGKPDMRKNLNPETLFRPGHWDRYLDEAHAAADTPSVLPRRLRSDLDSIGAPPGTTP